MERYPYAKRVLILTGAVFGLWLVFAFGVRIVGVGVAGVEPEAWVLTAMMTGPFALAGIVLLAGVTAGVERIFRKA